MEIRGKGLWLWAAVATATLLVGGCSLGGGLGSGGAQGIVAEYAGKEPPLTILLAEYQGPQSQTQADTGCADMKSKGLGDAFVIADNDEAFLCYGIYQDRLEKKHQADKTKIASVVDPMGRPIFGRGLTVLLPETTPPSPWDLSTADGRYTLMVASFDVYNRRHMATDHAAELRRKGWPAYVYHGERMSHVTIGAFGPEIFKAAVGTTARPLTERDKKILENLQEQMMFNTPLLQQEIASPEVKRIMSRFPYLNWNGHQFTEREAQDLKIKMRREATAPGMQNVPAEQTEVKLNALVASRIVVIPAEIRGRGIPARETPTTPTGPILSPGL